MYKKLIFSFFFFSICFNVFATIQDLKNKNGILIVGVGISGCGKSATFKELQKLLGCKLFLEPEEHEIPKEFLERENCDDFTLSLGYRSIRVPQLIRAKKLRDSGYVVLLDSYYNKIMTYYINKKSFDWLISKESPYYEAYKNIIELDSLNLPNADVIILFDITEKDWRKNLHSRGRKSDNDPGFLDSYNTTSDIEEAVFMIAKQFGIKVIRFKQEFSTPKIQAEKLMNLLKNENILQ